MDWSRDLDFEQITWLIKLKRCEWITPAEKRLVTRVLNKSEYGPKAQITLRGLRVKYKFHKRK